MGMFDSIKCSANIGALTDITCQTKDIDPIEGGSMSFYWVDPNGMLWSTDYTGCTSMSYKSIPGEPIWRNITYLPTGTHGRVYRVYINYSVKIYDVLTQPDGYQDTTECLLHFNAGELQNFSYINNSIEN